MQRGKNITQFLLFVSSLPEFYMDLILDVINVGFVIFFVETSD